jgi:hypothetical protein
MSDNPVQLGALAFGQIAPDRKLPLFHDCRTVNHDRVVFRPYVLGNGKEIEKAPGPIHSAPAQFCGSGPESPSPRRSCVGTPGFDIVRPGQSYIAQAVPAG